MRHLNASTGSFVVGLGLIMVVAGVVLDSPALAVVGVLGLLAGLYSWSGSS